MRQSRRTRYDRKGSLIPDIGTAWLVLSHGTWFGASIAATSVALNESTGPSVQYVWAAMAIVIQLWTFYAIETTRRTSSMLEVTIFGAEAFIMLYIMNFLVMGSSIWSLIALTL